MLSVSKPASLIQQKKQQWAREREEMSHLYLPWGTGERYTNRMQVRNQFASTLELHKQSSYEYQEPIQRQRSPSLPPIHQLDEKTKEEKRTKEVINRNVPSAKRFAFYDDEGEGDTSGYGSETVNHIRSGLADVNSSRNPVTAWQQEHPDNRNNSNDRLGADGWSGRSPRSSTAEEGRLRWGDRGVATGRLWEPTAPNARLPQVPSQKKGTPSWVERGLNMIENTEVLVIDQTSSTNSGFDCDRSSCNGSEEGKTYLRGQNVPIDSEIKAQRENKRLKALQLQSEILSQLENQEKRRQEERERQLREERLEELRVQRQQEEDQLRQEEEKRKNEEKQLLEQRKLETLKRALEEAERKARLEKEKRFACLKQNLHSSLPSDINIKNSSQENIAKEVPTLRTEIRNETVSPTKSNRTYDIHSAKSQKKDSNSQQTTGFNSPRSIGPGNLNLFIHNTPPMLADNQFNIVPIGINGNGELVSAQPNGIQLAVLVPQNISNNLYAVSLNSLNSVTEPSEPAKVLTPRKYRIPKTKDVYTQTDLSIIQTINDKVIVADDAERNNDKYYSNIDENAPHDSHHSTLKKDRRRSEDRYKKDLENRPKWGVNRPVAQYKKQSEKDPFYSQKRKMRQKYRAQARQYLSQSSDDSRSPSPPARSEKPSDNSKRNSLSQSYWRNKRTSNNTISDNTTTTSSLTVEFTNIGQVNNEIENKKISPKMSPSKRLTLSQKFINDKYGNRKLWVNDMNEKNLKPNNLIDGENRKKIIDQINIAKKEYMERNDDQENYAILPNFKSSL